MAVSLRPAHLKRYKDLARLFLKYVRPALVSQGELSTLLAESDAADEPDVLAAGAGPAEAEAFADELERLGPTFVKLGQVLSSRADLLPVPYLTALARLQDRVEPFGFGAVEAIVEAELGVRISKAFSEFEAEPIAAASLGQVHRAAMRDGRRVAVKVQRPGIRETLADDVAALAEVATLLDRHTEAGRLYGFTGFVEEFRKSLVRELDYRLEAQSLVQLGENLAGFERIVVPQPVDDYTTARVLTMDYVRGQKVTEIGPLARMEMDGAALADELFGAYLQQVLVDGFFHADPHAGNVFLTEDGRLALLDLGMVGRVSVALQEKLLRLLLALGQGRGEEVAAIAESIGEKREEFDSARFTQVISSLVAETQGATLEQISVGRLVLELTRRSAEIGLRLPPELALLGKTLFQLDRIAHTLDPSFSPNDAIRRHGTEVTTKRLRKSASREHLLASLHEAREFVERLPGRANKILERVANNELEIKIDALDEQMLMEGFQKVANRITVGLVLAALIVGAAMLMDVETSFRVFGYPGLAILCFLAAAAGGIGLVGSIVWNDRRRRGAPGR